jgi:hypothetical protein
VIKLLAKGSFLEVNHFPRYKREEKQRVRERFEASQPETEEEQTGGKRAFDSDVQ